MKIIFCADPLERQKPDEVYQGEAETVKALGFNYAIIDFEALVDDNDTAKAVSRVPTEDTYQVGIYRGWMLRPEQYEKLYQALYNKRIILIDEPKAYTHCHYLPESYQIIETKTPKSVWLRMEHFSTEKIMEILQPFGSKSIIVKDFVKSQKHYWSEACYIPSAANQTEVERVVKRFIELQSEYLNEGLVFREFIEFEALTTHSKSGMPLIKEYRLFVYDGKPFYTTEYWEEGEYDAVQPPIEEFLEIAQNVKSRFFTMDVAKQKNGNWLIVELGDAQVAGLPENVEAKDFYEALLFAENG